MQLLSGRLRLEGKVAIVTGAGSSGPGFGIGKATSILFAREGARVLLVDRVAQAAEETLATIREEGGEASVFEEKRKPIMKVVSTTFRKPCCSSTYSWAPNTLAAGTSRSRSNASRSLGLPTN